MACIEVAEEMRLRLWRCLRALALRNLEAAKLTRVSAERQHLATTMQL
jgi:hypothetical protein